MNLFLPRTHVARALLALLLFTAAAAQSQPLRLAVSKGPVSLAFYVAQAKGYFQRESADVVIQDCSSGRNCMALLAGGNADVATAADVLTALSGFTRSDLLVIATISTSSHQIKLVGRRSAGLEDPQQLRGKRVGTAPGTSAHYFLDSWLVFQAIDPSAVTLVPLAPDALPGALQRREVNAIAIWEPLASNALLVLGSDGLMLPNPRIYTQHFNLITSQGATKNRRSELSKMLQALLRAQQFIRDEPAEAAQILANRMITDLPTAQAQMKEHDFRLRLDQSLASTLSSQIRWVSQSGLVKQGSAPPNPLQLVEPALLREVSPKSVDLVK